MDQPGEKKLSKDGLHYALNLVQGKPRKIYFTNFKRMSDFVDETLMVQGFGQSRLSQYEVVKPIDSTGHGAGPEALLVRHKLTQRL